MAAEFLSFRADAAKQQVPVFICHLLEIKQNENTNLTHGDVFTHNWFPRYAVLQLYGLLVDSVWTGLLSLAALNKHLLEGKKVGYVSRKIKFMLQNSSKTKQNNQVWTPHSCTKGFFLPFCFFDTKAIDEKCLLNCFILRFFLTTAPTEHRLLGYLHLYSQSKDDAVTFSVTSAPIPQGRTAITRPSWTQRTLKVPTHSICKSWPRRRKSALWVVEQDWIVKT